MSFLSEQDLLYSRAQGGSLSNGEWIGTFNLSTSFRGAIQPGPGTNMQMVPDGWRNRVVLRLYTLTELHTISSVVPDRVLWDGDYYVVISKEDWSHSALSTRHIKYYLVREEDYESDKG